MSFSELVVEIGEQHIPVLVNTVYSVLYTLYFILYTPRPDRRAARTCPHYTLYFIRYTLHSSIEIGEVHVPILVCMQLVLALLREYLECYV